MAKDNTLDGVETNDNAKLDQIAQPVIQEKEKLGTAADAAAVDSFEDDNAPKVDSALLNGQQADQTKTTSLPSPDAGLIKELQSKSDVWMRWYNFCGWIYWMMGAASVAFSTLGASDVIDPKARPVCALFSAICLGVIGFANPQKKAAKFIGAYRLLEPSVRSYKYGILPKADLLAKDREAESMLNEGDFDGK